MERDRSRAMNTACLSHNLRKATRAVTRVYDAALRPTGLRVTQFSILNAVNAGGETALGTLAEWLGLDRTTLSRNLDRLEERGLVRSAAGRDERVRSVSITDDGLSVLDEAHPRWAEAQERLARTLGEQNVERLLQELDTLDEAARSA